MSDPARRKEKQRLKRKQKQLQIRRAKNVSPARIFSIASERGLPLECYCNGNWKEQGICSITCLRQIPGGTYAMAAFLVDLWCIGLKDAWGNVQIARADFLSRMEARGRGVGIEPMDEADARALVAGAVRFSNQNGFRLPSRWERWASLLGDIGDPAEADLSDFGKDGKLLFVGNMEDLARRLIVGTPQEFFSRQGRDFIADISGPSLVDEDAILLDEGMKETEARALNTIRQWLFANGRAPHPRLREAMSLFLESILLSDAGSEDDLPARSQKAMEVFTSTMTPGQRIDFADAMKQIDDFAIQFDRGEAFAEAIGFGAEDEV